MRLRGLLALFAALSLMVAACDAGEPVEGLDDDADAPAEDPAAEGEPAEGGTLIAGISGEPDQLDPHLTTAYPSFQVLENVYDTLVQPDADLEFEPALATEWEVSDDELTWTFTLREGVVWHDGSEFTADDVVASYDRIMEEGANAFRFEAVEDVRAADELTVEIDVGQPTPNLLANLGGFKGMAIVPAAAIEAGTLGDEPIGTGPFRFADYTPGQTITLEANEDYWGEGPFIDGVEYRFIAEGTVALTNLQTAEIDWTDNIAPQDVAGVLEGDDLESDAVPSNDYWYFALNNEREPFDQVEVRQALAFGFDREALTQAALFDAATPNQTAIPEDDPFYFDYAPFEHDPDQAQQLLADAGATDLTIDLMVTNEFEETVQAAQVLEAQWSEIGVSTEIRVLDFGAWLDEQGQGNFDAFLLGWLGNIDPDDYYYSQHVCDGANNYHGYCNPEVDELLEQGRSEMDQDARQDIYEQAVQLIVDEASYVYLYNPDVVQAWQPVVQDYEVRADRAIRFENVRLER